MILLQSVIFNKIVLFGVATPMVLVYFIVKLPVKMNNLLVLTFAFLLGLSVDVFANTLGMAALACVLTAYIRTPLLRLFYGYDNDANNYIIGLRRGSVENFMKFISVIVTIYCAIIFITQAFTLFNMWELLLKIISSAVVTVLLIIAFESISSTASGGKRL